MKTAVSTCTFDVVRRLEGVRAAWQPLKRPGPDTEPTGYVVGAAIPLKSLGVEIGAGKRLRFDWGVLETDRNGTVVLARKYWANPATSTLADLPTEAQLQPDLWVTSGLHTKPKDKFGATGLLESDQERKTEGLNLEEP